MKNASTISIIVPVYNVENYLPYCLESIQNQTFTDFECILINDGSTDSSGMLCDNICKKDSRFKVFHQKNQGYQTARNTGLQHIHGKYISFIDSDDYIHFQMLEILYKTLTQNPQCSFSMIYGKISYNHIIENKKIEPTPPIKFVKQKDLIKSLYGRNKDELQYQVIWNKLYKKDIIDKHSLTFTAGAWYEDLRFVKKYMLYATKFV